MAKNTPIPEQTADQTPPDESDKSAENPETEQTTEQSSATAPTENQDAAQTEDQTPPDELMENQETEQEFTDIDIIYELNEAVKLQRTKRPEFVAKLIKEILAKEFVKSDDEPKYTNAIYEIKEYIGNIKKNCPYRPSKCIVKVEHTLKRLNDGEF